MRFELLVWLPTSFILGIFRLLKAFSVAIPPSLAYTPRLESPHDTQHLESDKEYDALLAGSQTRRVLQNCGLIRLQASLRRIHVRLGYVKLDK